MQGISAEEHTNSDDVVYVVHHTEDKEKPCNHKKNRGMWIKFYKKIKHRFLVFEDIGLTKGYTSFSRKYEDVVNGMI